MMNRNNEELLDGLLERWEALLEQGQDVSAEELCRDCPHLAAELAHRITALKEMASLLDPDKPIVVTQHQDEPNLPSQSLPYILVGRYRLAELIAEGGHVQVWKRLRPEVATLRCRHRAEAESHGIGGCITR